MPNTSTAPIAKLLDSLEPIVTMERDGLVLIALGTSHLGESSSYLTLEEALAVQAIAIHEVGEGSVPTVAVETHDWPVVIFGGDTIVGGKQNRIVNVTMWLPAAKKTLIPVTCLEHGRWDPGTALGFGIGPKADLRLRSMLNAQVHDRARATVAAGTPVASSERYAADQHGVWNEVAMRYARAESTSRTDALHDLYAAEAADVERLARAFPCPDGAIGAAIALGGHVTALEVFDARVTTRKLWTRLIQGAVRAHLDHRRSVARGDERPSAHRYPDRQALGRMLDRVRAAQPGALCSPSVGEGTDVRFRDRRTSGAALVRDGAVVHLEAHRLLR